MIITEQSHPALFRAFVAVEIDNGAGHVGTTYPSGFDKDGKPVYEPINLSRFEVPLAWEPLVNLAESGLSDLLQYSEQQFETFICGEYSEQETIQSCRGNLAEADRLLKDWFNGWQAEDAP